MEKKEVLTAIKQVRESAKKRKFSQSFDVIINLKNINVKKENERVKTFNALPHAIRKTVRVTALIDKELTAKAKDTCENIILLADFKKYDKKAIKQIAAKTDFFIAQANIMPKVAAKFGKLLGPRGLMPNPKMGCIVPPAGEIKPLVERLKRMIELETKGEPMVKTSVGKEDMKDDDLAENILAVYNTVLGAVPQEKNNIKNILLKLTMSAPVIIGKELKKTKDTPEK